MGFYLRSAGRVRQPAFGAPINCADAAAFANCQRDVEFG